MIILITTQIIGCNLYKYSSTKYLGRYVLYLKHYVYIYTVLSILGIGKCVKYDLYFGEFLLWIVMETTI